MITERPPRFSVSFGTIELATTDINSVHIESDVGHHEYASVDLKAYSPRDLAAMADAPMRIEFGWQGGATKVKVGYYTHADVEHLSATASGSVKPQVLLHMMGPTIVLQSGAQRVWRDRNATSVITELLTAQRMYSDVDAHTYVWPLLAQTSESDWQMINELAQSIGYEVVADNTTVRAIDPVRALSTAGSEILSFQVPDSGTPGVYSFSPRLGMRNPQVDNVALERWYLDTDRVASHVQQRPSTGMGLVSMGTFGQRAVTDQPVHSEGEAALANYASAVANLWSITAEAVVPGSPSLTPGQMVQMVTSQAEYGGLWYVRSVRHTITATDFTTAMSLGKDAVGVPRARSFAGTRDWASTPTSRRINGRWVSEWAA